MTEILSKIESSVMLQFLRDFRPPLTIRCENFAISLEKNSYEVCAGHIMTIGGDFPKTIGAKAVSIEFSHSGCTFRFPSWKKTVKNKAAFPLSSTVEKIWLPLEAKKRGVLKIFVKRKCGEKIECAPTSDFNSDEKIFELESLKYERVQNVAIPAVAALSARGAVFVFDGNFPTDSEIEIEFSQGFFRRSFLAHLAKILPAGARKIALYRTAEIAPETQRFLRENFMRQMQA